MMTRKLGTMLVMAVTMALAAAPGAWAAPPVAETPRSIIAILIGLFQSLL